MTKAKQSTHFQLYELAYEHITDILDEYGWIFWTK